MEVDLIFQIAAIGIIVAVLNQLLVRSGREEQAMMTTLAVKSSRVKVEIGLCKGKKLHDKRDSIAARDAKREMDRAMKERNR